jgi:DUF2075 family protein/integrase
LPGHPKQTTFLPVDWAKGSVGDVLTRVRNIYVLISEGHSLKGAAHIADAKAPKPVADWSGAFDRFKVQKLQHGRTLKPETWSRCYLPVLSDVVDLMNGSSRPDNTADLMDLVIRKWEPGSRMRQIRAQSLSQFLRHCVARESFPSLWLPPAHLAAHVGAKGSQVGPGQKGDPLTDQQILDLLKALPADPAGVRWADAIRLMSELGLRPIELLFLKVKSNSEFTLIEEQKVVYEAALQLARKIRPGKRRVLLVRGGPGTGKSVVAIHLLAALTKKELNVRYVSKNAAPRHVYRAKLTGQMLRGRYDNLFCGSGAFVDCPPGHYDVLVVDEAHRLNKLSGLYGNQGENQVKEIINASHLSVFFLDEDQQVTWKDIGTESEIRQWAQALGAEISCDELPSQFRCAGSDGYLAWLDDLLGIRPTANPDLDLNGFDFQLFEDPVSLHQAVREANGSNRARLVAGYCWNWNSKKNPNLNDIVIPSHHYSARWNLAAEGNSWIISPTGVEEVGCVHTCQGLEVDTIGVIIGPDLVFRDGQLLVDPTARARSDKSLSGWRAALAEDPEGTKVRVSRLIRNTYRTLMSRGMRSCWVFACDEGLRKHLEYRTGSVFT